MTAERPATGLLLLHDYTWNALLHSADFKGQTIARARVVHRCDKGALS